jgi:hypothetical protein
LRLRGGFKAYLYKNKKIPSGTEIRNKKWYRR